MTAAGADPVDAKLEWLRFYCAKQLDLLPVYEMTPDGRCACGEETCRERDWAKHPRINWGAGATYNFSLVESWHRRWPSANWAWALKRHFTVDIDPRNGGWTGDELYEAWGNTLGFELPRTLRADSGGGGTHLVFRQPEGDPVRNGHLVLPDGRPLRGTDIKGAGGYILVHPSNHRSGGVYRWHDWVDPIAPPPELVECIRRRAQRSIAGGERDATTERVLEEAAGGFDLDAWVAEGADIQPGYQHDHLVRGLGWMRGRDYKRNAMIAVACTVAESYPTGDPDNPWTTAHVIELVTDMMSRYAPNVSGNIVIPRGYTPHFEGPAASGDPGGDGGGDVVPIGGAEGDDSFRLTHAWMKDQFLRNYGGDLRWTAVEGWHTWREDHWVKDEREVLRRLEYLVAWVRDEFLPHVLEGQERLDGFRRKLDGWLTIGQLKAIAELAEKDSEVDPAAFDQHPLLVNCPNGTVDLRTGELKPHDRLDMLTRMTTVPYERGARSELLDAYHATFMPDEAMQACLYRLLGMCMVGGNPYRIFPMLVGTTSTGKSQLVETIRRFLGDYAGVGGPNIMRGHLDERPRVDLLEMLPRRIGIFEEAGQAWELHVDQVKRLTGASAISARGNHANAYVTRVPEFTPMIVANAIPRIKDADSAMRRRLVVVPFDRSVELFDDPSLGEAFKVDEQVHKALLARILEGAREVIELKGLGELPMPVVNATMRAFTEMDDVAEFINTAVEEGALIVNNETTKRACIAFGDLYSMYDTWVMLYGDRVQKHDKLAKREFGKRIRALGWRVEGSGEKRVIGLVKCVTNTSL